MIKKIDGANAEIFKSWLHDNKETILNVDGKHYLIQPIKGIIQQEIEDDVELKLLIKQAKENIANGEIYTTQEIIDAIQNEDL
jgi:hypothetical protein